MLLGSRSEVAPVSAGRNRAAVDSVPRDISVTRGLFYFPIFGRLHH